MSALALFTVPLIVYEFLFVADLLCPLIGEIGCFIVVVGFHIGLVMLCRHFEVRCALLDSIKSELGRDLTKNEKREILKSIVKVTKSNE